MTETIEYEQFDQAAGGAGATAGTGLASGADADLSRLSDIPMELSVEIGRTHMTVGETLDLRVGSLVTLERLAGETADLLVNGTAIARGEVVVIDEQYGLRVTEILDSEHDGEAPGAASSPAGATTPSDGAQAPAAEDGHDAAAAEEG
jgi:flagellar motor switch protein FliN